MGRSDDPFWSRPPSPGGDPGDFFGDLRPPTGHERADAGAPGSEDRYASARDAGREPGYDDGFGGYPEPDPRGAEPGYADFDDDYGYADLEDERELAGVGGRGGRGSGGGRTPSGERRARPHSRRNLLWRWRRVFFILGLMGMAGVAAGVAVLAQAELPDDPTLQQASFYCPAGVTENCNAQNAMARISAEEDRDLVTLDQLKPVVIDAVISAEDRDFFTHKGINPVGIGRALYQDLRGGGLSQGGSTITQQLVKNSYLGSERTLTRKINEAVLSIKLEQSMSKEDILERYLNTIYFGRNAYGVQAASRVYFNKDVGQLRLREASYLAGLIRAPELADAQVHPDEATRRRKTVLDAMREEGYINQEQYDIVQETPLASYVVPRERYRTNKILEPNLRGKGMEYVNEYVRQQLVDVVGLTEEQIAQGGLRVYTTIDPGMQAAAWNSIYNPDSTDTPLNRPELPEGALVAIDDQGQIKAMAGGRDPNGGGIFFAAPGNASSGRPVGSTFKPIALAEAMQEGYSLSADLPAPAKASIQQTINGCGELWEPGNYNDSEYSTPTLDLASATKVSSNTAYANLMYQLSEEGTNTQKVRDMAVRLGMDEDELSDCLPIVLGASSSTPLEMAEIYSTFANNGVHKEPRIINRVEEVDQDGKRIVLWEATPKQNNVLSADQAAKVTYALQQVVSPDGTGHDAGLDGIPAAGKTGTTSSNKDAWFVGYTPKLTAAVWMGYPDPTWTDPEKIDPATGQFKTDPETGKPYTKEIPPMTADGQPVYGMPSITGGTIPAKIWHTFMTAVVHEPIEFPAVTPEQLQDGRPFDGGTFQNTPGTTVATPQPPGPGQTTLPPQQTTLPPPTPTTIPNTTIPDTTAPDTTIPGGTTTTTLIPSPGGGGGGGGGGRG